MKLTENYELKKPDGTDIVNIEDLNYNSDVVDTKLKELSIGKAENSVVSTTANGLMTKEDKVKLNGIAAGANAYVHPSTHPAAIITEDTNHRFATDSEKGIWNGKANNVAVSTTANGLMIKEDKVKLDGIAAGANVYVHPSTHPAAIITEDTNHRFATDSEKSTWNGKAANVAASTTANGLMTKEDKVKLNGVAAGANAYVHPSTHPATIITEDTTHRFVTDTEKSTWSGKAASNHNHDTVYASKEEWTNFKENGGTINGSITVGSTVSQDGKTFRADRQMSDGKLCSAAVGVSNSGKYMLQYFEGDSNTRNIHFNKDGFFPNVNGVTDLGYVDPTDESKYKWRNILATDVVSGGSLLSKPKEGSSGWPNVKLETTDGKKTATFALNKDNGVISFQSNITGVNKDHFIFAQDSFYPNTTIKDLGATYSPWTNLWLGGYSRQSNGYTKLPNGMIMQWGVIAVNVPAGGTNYVDINYPIAFPSYQTALCYANVYGQAGNTSNIYECNANISGLSSTQARIFVKGMAGKTTSINVSWMALGW